MHKNNHVTIDFETRSPTDIRYGAHRYAQDDQTEVMCLAWIAPGDADVNLWAPAYPHVGLPERGVELLPKLFKAIEDRVPIEAHNASFERAVWEYICVPKMGWPAILPEQWRCSASVAASFALPRSLDGVSQALNVSHKKDMTGNKIMKRISKPRAPLKKDMEIVAEQRLGDPKLWREVPQPKTVFLLNEMNPDLDLSKIYPWHEDKNDLEKLFSYCKDDVRVEKMVSERLSAGLSDKELKVWRLDQTMNFRGVHLDTALVDKALEISEECSDSANERISELTDGAVTSVNQRTKFLKWLNDQPGEGRLEDLQKATVEDAVATPRDWSDDAMEALLLRQSGSKTSTKKYEAMSKSICGDNRARGLLYYHGADTGRWAGRIVQPQNFPRGEINEDIDVLCEDVLSNDAKMLDTLYGDAMSVLSSALRGAITAAPGHDLICADYSAIEARGVFWLAGDTRALDILRSGKDIYKDMATQIYSVGYDEVTKAQRQTGKQAVLGLGYQMGAQKFQTTAEGYGMVFDEEFCQRVVRTYREVHHPVKSYWYGINDAAFEACRRGKGGDPVNFGRLQLFVSNEDFLHIRLPSDRLLSYYQPRVQKVWSDMFQEEQTKLTFMGVNSMSRQFCRQQTYGGKLTENVVQALSRDVMAEAMLRAEETGIYLPILTVHDEIVAEVPEGKGSVKEFESLISEKPDWADGLPLEAEGWRGVRYRK
jgi:DNA polymerase